MRFQPAFFFLSPKSLLVLEEYFILLRFQTLHYDDFHWALTLILFFFDLGLFHCKNNIAKKKVLCLDKFDPAKFSLCLIVTYSYLHDDLEHNVLTLSAPASQLSDTLA